MSQGGVECGCRRATWWRQKQPLPSHSLDRHGSAAEGAVPGCWEPHFGARRTLKATLSPFLVLAGLCRMPVLRSRPHWGLGDTGGQTLETPHNCGQLFPAGLGGAGTQEDPPRQREASCFPACSLGSDSHGQRAMGLGSLSPRRALL